MVELVNFGIEKFWVVLFYILEVLAGLSKIIEVAGAIKEVKK